MSWGYNLAKCSSWNHTMECMQIATDTSTAVHNHARLLVLYFLPSHILVRYGTWDCLCVFFIFCSAVVLINKCRPNVLHLMPPICIWPTIWPNHHRPNQIIQYLPGNLPDKAIPRGLLVLGPSRSESMTRSILLFEYANLNILNMCSLC